MTNREMVGVKMILSVLAALKTTDRTSGVAGLPARVTQLATQAEELNELGEIQLRPIQAPTAGRDALLQAMQDQALDVASAVALHAADAKLPDVLRTVKITAADFEAARVLHRPWFATGIANAAESVLPQLAPRVTVESLAELRAKIREAETAVAQPRRAIETRLLATARIKTVLKDAEATLAQIDRLVFPLRKTEPDFYAEYRSARRLLELPMQASTPVESTAPVAVPAAPTLAQAA
jgi:hypothetical protein